MVDIDLADRIKELPPYLFVKLDEMKAKAEGVDVIDSGIGAPDQPTPVSPESACFKIL